MKKAEKNFYVLAHNIRSLHNVGSIFRTADALGVGKIFLTGYTGTPKNPIHAEKISKVALGAETWLPWEYHKSPYRLIKKFQEQKIKIIALENNTAARNLRKFKSNRDFVLVLGEETKGIPKKLLKFCDEVVEIPMLGKKESLNVGVAFGIAAFVLSA